jgi:hypothetical protein
MNLYRARPIEVQAVNLGDGRYVILDEPPRYASAAEFEAAFELADERRETAPRRRANGRKPPKGEKRKSPGRRKKNGDPDPRQAEGLELLAKGRTPKQVATKLKVSQSAVYLWRKNAAKANGARPAAAPARPSLVGATAGKRHVEESNQDGDWMK